MTTKQQLAYFLMFTDNTIEWNGLGTLHRLELFLSTGE